MDANEFPEPDPHDVPKIREFIRKKYIEKQWCKKKKKSKKSKSKDKGGTIGEIPKAATSKTLMQRRIQGKTTRTAESRKKSIERSSPTK